MPKAAEVSSLEKEARRQLSRCPANVPDVPVRLPHLLLYTTAHTELDRDDSPLLSRFVCLEYDPPFPDTAAAHHDSEVYHGNHDQSVEVWSPSMIK